MTTYTDAQILEAMHRALRERNLEAAASLLCMLAVQAPATAELVRAAIEAEVSA